MEAHTGLEGLSLTDPWGTAWVYRTDGKHFVLASLGSDAARGPKPPADWANDVTEPDLVLRDNGFVQQPRDTRVSVSARQAMQVEAGAAR